MRKIKWWLALLVFIGLAYEVCKENIWSSEEMEWLKEILGVSISGAGGALFGGMGALGGAVVKYFQRRQEMSFQREKWDYEKDLFKLELENKRQEEEQELMVVSQKGSWDGLKASVQSESHVGEVHKIVNDIKALYRPLLTTGLVIVTYFIFRDMLNILRHQEAYLENVFSADTVRDILMYIIYSVVFSTCTAITWWYGDRAFSPPGMKNK